MGTTVRATFRMDPPDMKPLGDIVGTVELLGAYHPEINFVVDYEPITSKGAWDEA